MQGVANKTKQVQEVLLGQKTLGENGPLLTFLWDTITHGMHSVGLEVNCLGKCLVSMRMQPKCPETGVLKGFAVDLLQAAIE